MAFLPVRLIAKRIAQTLVGEALRRVLGPDLEDVQSRAFDRFGKRIEELTVGERQEVLEDLPPQRLRTIQRRANIMTDFNTFMSIGLNRCGSDERTFAALVQVWNREKERIQQMTPEQVRRNLECP